MHAEGRIGDELWTRLCMLVGHEMLAMTLHSLRVQPTRPRKGIG